jgi:hypothetical protein
MAAIAAVARVPIEVGPWPAHRTTRVAYSLVAIGVELVADVAASAALLFV